MPKKAIIIGAGPAGLTAALELLKRTDIVPIVLEKSGDIGGISKTINYKGNRMDMGPHRFFSKSDRVMDWWLKMMPLEENADKNATISYQNKSREIHSEGSELKDSDKVMLVIQRLTRIYFLRKFFAYPIQFSLDTLRTLGLVQTFKILVSFLWIRFFPRRLEISLEDFIVNKFGKELYRLFFKDYTEKVWGIAPSQIPAEWGAQRIKGVSLSKAISHAVSSFMKKKGGSIDQKETETSLIEQFLYPKYGPKASFWEEVARQAREKGGEIYLYQDVKDIISQTGSINAVVTVDSLTGEVRTWQGDYFFSTMPVQELIAGMGNSVPVSVQKVAAGLQYRDFINVGILLKQLSAKDGQRLKLKDNWIYIQERDVRVGRLMIYNNWGGGMIKDPTTTWIGMEYFCNKTDDFWGLSDEAIQNIAVAELEKMDLAKNDDVLDITVQRMEKTYPAYFGTYNQFDKISDYTDTFGNLFLVGRNGMHKYNNADHSMLTAMVAVDNIIAGVTSKANLWTINTEQEYHEEKFTERQKQPAVPTPSSAAAERSRRLQLALFREYIWNNKINRAYLIFALAACLVQFLLFKAKYPFANYMPDSYSYLEAAASNTDVNTWPVAYSKFLRIFSAFSHSDKLLVGFQYIFLQANTLFLLFSFFYFLQPARSFRNVLYAFILLNPIPLYIANYISADALFISMSLLWLSLLFWILYKPAIWQLFGQAILILVCFTLRYNAIYYPVLTVLAFLLSKQSGVRKAIGIGLGFFLITGSFIYTSQKMETVTGKRQFSAFGGWQLANNALYMYEHIPSDQRISVAPRFERLEKKVREHMDTLDRVKLTKDDSISNFFYLWSPKGPLIQYMNQDTKKDSAKPYFIRWASEGPLYEDYAIALIRQYPVQFLKTFLFRNSIKFAVPPQEFLGVYNMGSDSVNSFAKDWFNYKSQKVMDHNNSEKNIVAISWFPVFIAIANTILLVCLLGLFFFGGLRIRDNPIFKTTLLLTALWLMNMVFSILAAPIVLRYQIFPVIVSILLATILLEYILNQDNQTDKPLLV